MAFLLFLCPSVAWASKSSRRATGSSSLDWAIRPIIVDSKAASGVAELAELVGAEGGTSACAVGAAGIACIEGAAGGLPLPDAWSPVPLPGSGGCPLAGGLRLGDPSHFGGRRRGERPFLPGVCFPADLPASHEGLLRGESWPSQPVRPQACHGVAVDGLEVYDQPCPHWPQKLDVALTLMLQWPHVHGPRCDIGISWLEKEWRRRSKATAFVSLSFGTTIQPEACARTKVRACVLCRFRRLCHAGSCARCTTVAEECQEEEKLPDTQPAAARKYPKTAQESTQWQEQEVEKMGEDQCK